MSGPNLHNALLRPPIIQILRAAGFHATRPSVLDTMADLTARYVMILASSATTHAANAHPNNPVPTLEDIYQALQDAGALRPQLREWEEDWHGDEDMRGLEGFLGWFTGPANREIRRIAGFLPSEGDVVDTDFLEKEDYLTVLKKKHSKTGEESRYAGTVLGKNAEEHPIVIEGGAPSIQEWGSQVRSRAHILRRVIRLGLVVRRAICRMGRGWMCEEVALREDVFLVFEDSHLRTTEALWWKDQLIGDVGVSFAPIHALMLLSG
ncbi:Bromodomain associated domain protein [Aspergillus arachidicola]|uniref:Bromodomain associated domain protein n=1 Tax=Aspergillus arachidicola TaxID=656916 RepID=A0A2G7FI53_9EURO|nr:Bromodomain associated domain protein [Aspergillus arachidicola]